jgi:hypothetical protein
VALSHSAGSYETGRQSTPWRVHAVPLSKSQREVIERLRAWLRDGRAQSASFPAASLAEQAQVRLELN